jgi:16S rRNA (cytosine967-C5)-methyltransferase
MAARIKRYAYADRVRCEVADAKAPLLPENELFDLILCDVPCSGTGTLTRNPEIRHRLCVEDLARHAARQRAILSSALQRLAPGGRLVYSTCSLEPEENEAVVDAITAEASCSHIPVTPLIGMLAQSNILSSEVSTQLLRSAVRDGALRTLPGVHPCDGFYATVFERS